MWLAMLLSNFSSVIGPILGMNAAPCEILRPKRFQDPSHVPPTSGDQLQLLFHIASLIGQPSSKQVGIAAEKSRFLLSDDALHAIDVDRLEIGNVTNDLPRRPFAGNRLSIQLIGRHALNRSFEVAVGRPNTRQSTELDPCHSPVNVFSSCICCRICFDRNSNCKSEYRIPKS